MQTAKQLQAAIDKELGLLNPKLRRFALVYAAGDKNQEEAAVEAGYSSRGLRKNAYRYVRLASKVIGMLERLKALESGDTISEHRRKLLTLWELCAQPNSPTWEPRTAHSISRTLLELDGHINGKSQLEQQVTINILDPVAGITIDGEIENPPRISKESA